MPERRIVKVEGELDKQHKPSFCRVGKKTRLEKGLIESVLHISLREGTAETGREDQTFTEV